MDQEIHREGDAIAEFFRVKVQGLLQTHQNRIRDLEENVIPAKDARIRELEKQVEALQETVARLQRSDSKADSRSSEPPRTTAAATTESEKEEEEEEEEEESDAAVDTTQDRETAVVEEETVVRGGSFDPSIKSSEDPSQSAATAGAEEHKEGEEAHALAQAAASTLPPTAATEESKALSEYDYFDPTTVFSPDADAAKARSREALMAEVYTASVEPPAATLPPIASLPPAEESKAPESTSLLSSPASLEPSKPQAMPRVIGPKAGKYSYYDMFEGATLPTSNAPPSGQGGGVIFLGPNVQVGSSVVFSGTVMPTAPPLPPASPSTEGPEEPEEASELESGGKLGNIGSMYDSFFGSAEAGATGYDMVDFAQSQGTASASEPQPHQPPAAAASMYDEVEFNAAPGAHPPSAIPATTTPAAAAAAYDSVEFSSGSGSQREPSATTQAPAAAAPSPGMDWNEQFQRATEMPTGTAAERLTRAVHMYRISKAFTEAARDLAKQIVDELRLPSEQRTIQPVDVGGVAGGEKYIRNGIFLKFARDWQGQYSFDIAVVYLPS